MKRVTNDWRSSIETIFSHILLRITISGCSLDAFDPQRAIQHVDQTSKDKVTALNQVKTVSRQ